MVGVFQNSVCALDSPASWQQDARSKIAGTCRKSIVAFTAVFFSVEKSMCPSVSLAAACKCTQWKTCWWRSDSTTASKTRGVLGSIGSRLSSPHLSTSLQRQSSFQADDLKVSWASGRAAGQQLERRDEAMNLAKASPISLQVLERRLRSCMPDLMQLP